MCCKKKADRNTVYGCSLVLRRPLPWLQLEENIWAEAALARLALPTLHLLSVTFHKHFDQMSRGEKKELKSLSYSGQLQPSVTFFYFYLSVSLLTNWELVVCRTVASPSVSGASLMTVNGLSLHVVAILWNSGGELLRVKWPLTWKAKYKYLSYTWVTILR